MIFLFTPQNPHISRFAYDPWSHRGIWPSRASTQGKKRSTNLAQLREDTTAACANERRVNIYTRPSRWPWKSSVAVVLFGSTRRRCISRHASPSKSSTLRLIRSFNESRWPSFHVFAEEERFDGFVLSSFVSVRKVPGEKKRKFGRRCLIVIIKFQHNGGRGDGGGYEISTNVILSSAE